MNTTQTPPRPSTSPFTPRTPIPAPPPASPEPPAPNLSRVLDDFYDPDRHTLRLCDSHQLSIDELAEIAASDQFERIARNIRRITEIRLEIAKAEAEVAAWFRLMDLAGNFPTNPRDRETSRKAAAQILRELKKPRAPAHAPGAEGFQPSDTHALGAEGFQPSDRPTGDASPLAPSTPLNPLPDPTPPATQETPPCQPAPSASPPPTLLACAPSVPRPSSPTPGPSAPPPATTASSPSNSPDQHCRTPTTRSSPSKILATAGATTGVELMAACP